MSRVCPSWLSFILYNPLRSRLIDRVKILDESRIGPESVVLEIGAGNGFFTEAIAKRAKKVICIELQEGMAKKLKKRTGSCSDKVHIITADIAAYSPEGPFADVCLLYYCFHEVANKPVAAVNIGRAVKKGGTLAVYEPTVEVGRKDMQRTIALFEEKGFHKEAEHSSIFSRFSRLRKTGAENH